MSKSHFASITSSPLFTSVEESTVIFRPIDQFGCFKASSTVISASSSFFLPRKGPPDAVRRILLTRLLFSPCMDWKIALCSLSTGKMETLFFFARGMMICPAVTSVSLLASAMVFPASIAAMVGLIPIMPTMAVTKTSISSITAISRRPSIPPRTSVFVSATLRRSSFAASSSKRTASRGENSLICSSIFFTFLPAARAVTCKSLLFLTISSVCVPMEPVEPKIPVFFIFSPV